MRIRTSILLTLLIAAALACQAVTPSEVPTASPASTPDSLHFDSEWLAFDYPPNMRLFTGNDATFSPYPYIDLGGELVAGLGDDRFLGFGSYFRSIRVIRRPFPAGTNLDQLMEDLYAQPGAEHPWPLVEGPLDLNGPIAISGHEGIQKSYRIYSGEPAYDLRDVWIPVDTQLFIVSISAEWTNPDDVSAFESTADDLLDSLVIKADCRCDAPQDSGP